MTFHPDLYLLRHGQTEWNRAGRMQGHLDSPLTGLGIRQAQRQAEIVTDILMREPGITLYSSPLGRARLSAVIAFGGREAVVDLRLIEIDVGEAAGRSSAALAEAGSRRAAYDAMPGGEGIAALRARVSAFLADLTGPAMIMTHGVTLCMLRMVAAGLPDQALDDMDMQQGAVHVVRDGRFRLID